MRLKNLTINRKGIPQALLVNDDGIIVIQATLACILKKIKERGYKVEGINTPLINNTPSDQKLFCDVLKSQGIQAVF